MIRRLFGCKGRVSDPVDYEDAKRLARDETVEERRTLVGREDAQPEILYYLAEDESPVVRRQIAANKSTPRQADVMLAGDDDDQVRCDLALKIARLLPDLKPEEQTLVRELTLQALEVLAQDELPRVRQILSEELKEADYAPVEVVERLARDVELVVAAPILEYSPLLSDNVILEIVESDPVQGALNAVARRKQVAAPIADAIVAAADVPAVASLLANSNAQIREETLDQIIDGAPEVQVWHEPLVRRDDLSQGSLRRISNFVASSLLSILQERSDLDEETVRHVAGAVKRRLEEDSKSDVSELSRTRAEKMYADGMLDDDMISAEIDKKNHEFVINSIALMAQTDIKRVRTIMESRSGKSVTSLAFCAGLTMPTAMQFQNKVAKVPAHGRVTAKKGGDYPLSEDEMSWHVEFFE